MSALVRTKCLLRPEEAHAHSAEDHFMYYGKLSSLNGRKRKRKTNPTYFHPARRNPVSWSTTRTASSYQAEAFYKEYTKSLNFSARERILLEIPISPALTAVTRRRSKLLCIGSKLRVLQGNYTTSLLTNPLSKSAN